MCAWLPDFPFLCCYTCSYSISSHLDYILTCDVSMQLYSRLLVIFDVFVDLCKVHWGYFGYLPNLGTLTYHVSLGYHFTRGSACVLNALCFVFSHITRNTCSTILSGCTFVQVFRLLWGRVFYTHILHDITWCIYLSSYFCLLLCWWQLTRSFPE